MTTHRPPIRVYLPILASLVLVLSACATVEPAESEADSARQRPVQPAPAPAPVPARPRFEIVDDGSTADGRQNRFGSGGALVSAPRIAEPMDYDGPDADEVVKLQFASVSIREVARTILTDVFGVNFVMHPDIEGETTLDFSQGMKKRHLFTALRTLLNGYGATLIKDDDLYLVTPRAQQAAGEAIKLNNTTASQIAEVLKAYNEEGAIRPGPDDSTLIIDGSAPAARELRDLALFLDSAEFSKLAYGLFPAGNLQPAAAAAALSNFLAIKTNNARATAQAIGFADAVLVVAKDTASVRAAERFLTDLSDSAAEIARKLYVYRVQHGEPSEMATLLSTLFAAPGDREDTSAEPNAPADNVTPAAQASITVTGPLADSAQPGPDGAGAENFGDDGFFAEPFTPNPTAVATPGTRREGPRFVAADTRNTLLIEATAAEFARIRRTLDRIDTPAPQVLIEATIAEVTLNDTLRYGVQFFFQSGQASAILSQSTTPGVLTGLGSDTENSLVSGVLGAAFPGFALADTVGDIQIALQALDEVTELRIVSSPQILIGDNQSARLQVGDEVPVITQTATSVLTSDSTLVNNIEYRDTGVILTVRPEITAGDRIALDIAQEVSSVVPTTTSEIESPTFQQRRVRSRVYVDNNQIIALGGLIQENSTDEDSGIPLLKDIPGVGNLFGSTSVLKNRTEVLILIKPVIVRQSNDLRQRTDELRSRFRAATRALDSLL